MSVFGSLSAIGESGYSHALIQLGILAPDEGFLVGLDPVLYDPLPLGISVYAKDENAAIAGTVAATSAPFVNTLLRVEVASAGLSNSVITTTYL